MKNNPESELAALGEMASGIAHEINTPLATIALLAEELMMSGIELSPEQTANANLILETTDRIAKIVLGLKTFARDGSQEQMEVTTASALIDDTLALCRARFASQSIEVKVVSTHPQIEVKCRATQITQVLLNLLNNSFDAFQTLPNKWIQIEMTAASDRIIFAISDSGTGIDTETQKKLMQPFFTSKPFGQGTGLGLSISKGLIESHGGVFFYDVGRVNTTFVFELPRAQAA